MEDGVFDLLSRRLNRTGDAQEIAAILYFDADYRLLDTTVVEGEADTLEFPSADVVRQGAVLGAQRLLLFHTHPSGDPRPSRADIALTRRLCIRLRHNGLRLIDHVILTESRYFSFRANGLL